MLQNDCRKLEFLCHKQKIVVANYLSNILQSKPIQIAVILSLFLLHNFQNFQRKMSRKERIFLIQKIYFYQAKKKCVPQQRHLVYRVNFFK
jgi:hypothetical protein